MTPPNINPIDLMINLTLKGDKDIDEHLLTLFALTLSMKPALIIELGVRTARSTLPFLVGADPVNAKVVSVDINEVRPDFNFPEPLKERWEFIQKDALKFLEDDFPKLRESQNMEEKERGDIIYIDDWHAGDHVRRELELISDLVTPKDLIILHDLMYGNSQPNYRSVENPSDKQWGNGGPYKPISELDLSIWEYMTIPRCHGLTLLRKKADEVYTS